MIGERISYDEECDQSDTEDGVRTIIAGVLHTDHRDQHRQENWNDMYIEPIKSIGSLVVIVKLTLGPEVLAISGGIAVR